MDCCYKFWCNSRWCCYGCTETFRVIGDLCGRCDKQGTILGNIIRIENGVATVVIPETNQIEKFKINSIHFESVAPFDRRFSTLITYKRSMCSCHHPKITLFEKVPSLGIERVPPENAPKRLEMR